MEGLTRLVSESMARHGFDRPLDYRRLHWSRWFRCESHHSLLFVPSKAGVFALAEEITDLGDAHVATAASAVPPKRSEAELREVSEPRRMLAVTQFFEDDDMAFVLDRMLSSQNPMRARLVSGRYFVRFVVIEDQTQRRTICNALNQWMVTTAEKATGIGSHFATSLELTPATEYVPNGDDHVAKTDVGQILLSAKADATEAHVARTCPERESNGPSPASQLTAPQLDSGAATNIHRSNPFPSGF
jgi:hypothetical protein